MKATNFKINWSGRALDYTQDEIDTVVEVMRRADPLTQGRHLAAFEARFAQYHGGAACFGVTNCAHALELSAVLSRLGPGDEVIMPAHTYCASAIPFGRTGATLVWADIDARTWVISAESVRERLTPRTKAIVVVHLYGLMAEMDKIAAIAAEHGCILVEDCAQSLGAEYRGRKAGEFGDYGCYSFHAQKNLTTLGEGGALRVKSVETARLVPGLRHNGHIGYPADREHFWQPAMTNVDVDLSGVWPFNYSLGEAQCALATKMLDRIDAINAERGKRGREFRAALADFPELVFQHIPDECKHAWHLLPARYDGSAWGKTRDDLLALMAYDYGVKFIVQYYPLYRYPLFQKMGFGAHACPETDRFFDHMVSIPFHVWMSDADFSFMIDSTRQALTRLRQGQ
jgi:perosamine synthetase